LNFIETLVRRIALRDGFGDILADGTRRAALERIRQGVLATCGKIPEQEAARATCDGFLAPA